ncbi:MAG: substrate-binding domain-containing protein [Acidimicrobiales bacterium]
MSAPARRAALVVAAALPALAVIAGVPRAWADAPSTIGTSASDTCPQPVATPTPTELSGEGGSFAQPVISKLLLDEGTALQQLGLTGGGRFGNVNVDLARCDLAEASVDFGVTEFPLTDYEVTQATSKGRTYAYVPLAAVPVAIAAVVFCSGDQTYKPNGTQCANLQLTVKLLAQIFGQDVTYWNDAKLNTISGGKSGITPTSNSNQINVRVLEDPAASTFALESLFESDTTAKPAWDQFLTAYHYDPSKTGAVETWPTHQGVHGGDQDLANLLFPVDDSGKVVTQTQGMGQGDIAPLPADWLAVPWGASSGQLDIPTIAIENAAGSFVTPSVASATAALSHATLDPATNLVTFVPSTTDMAAYPIMAMSYLVVPTSGLSALKATALSDLISYAYSAPGQKDITDLGGVPPTTAMMQAGRAVSAKLSQEATTASGSSGSTSGGTSTSSGTTAGVGGSGATAAAAGSSPSTDSAGGTGSPSLAFTGADPFLLVVAGSALAVSATLGRRWLRRRRTLVVES